MLIDTSRCQIRNFEEKDLDQFMMYRNDASWMRYQGFKGLTKQEYRKVLLREFSLHEGVQLAIVLKDKDCLIGDIYLKQEANTIWFGYTINPIYAKQGYAYEAASEIITWISKKGIGKIFAATLPENTPSISLLKKLKFKFVGMNDYGEEIYAFDLNCSKC